MSDHKLGIGWVEEDKKHLLHGEVPLDEFAEKGTGLIIDEAHGIRIRDIHGREYIDALSGLNCVNVGYSRLELAQAAMEQMRKLSYFYSGGDATSTATIEYCSRLAEFLPEGLGRVFLANSGAEANESAYKLARFYWATRGKEGKYKIISREMGYHGLNMATLWVTGMPSLQKKVGPPIAGFPKIPACYCYRCPLNKNYPDCDLACAQALAETIEREGPDTIAAFVAEPVYGVGGSIAPPPEYFPKIRKICDQYNVLLILDEIITGFGRTGKNFCCQHWDVTPDMMCMAKGMISAYLPISGVAINQKLFKEMIGPDSFPHLHTCGGHPVACAVALKHLEIVIREDLVGNAARMGAYLMGRLKDLGKYPHVGPVHGMGLLLGLEVVRNKKTKEAFPEETMKKLIGNIRKQGVIVRSCESRVQIAPPLIVGKGDIDQIVAAVEAGLAEL